MTAPAKPTPDLQTQTNRANRPSLSAPLSGGSRGSRSWLGRLRTWTRPVGRSLGFAIAVAALMVLSSVMILPLAGASSGTSGSGATHASKVIPPTAHASSSATPRNIPGPYFGQSPSSEPSFTGQVSAYPTSTGRTPTTEQFQKFSHAGGFDGFTASSYASPVPSSSTHTPSAAPAALATATATGTIEDSLTHNPISGALVQPVPIGTSCPNQTCPPVYTGAQGTFTVTVLVGADEIAVSAGYYVDNYTVLTNVSAGKTYNLGILYLVPDAIVCGVVEGNDSIHETVQGVQVAGTSRDSRIAAYPNSLTSSTGTFTVPVPPGPSLLAFTPLMKWGLYLGTTLFVDFAAGQGVGHCVNIGVVYLPVGVVVTAQPYNRVTLMPITGTGYWAMQACARNSKGLCYSQGTSVGIGSAARTVAPVGPDTLQVMADGYMMNTTDVYVPAEPPGHTISLGRVYLLPMIQGNIWSNLTWQNAVQNARAKWGVGLVVGSSCSMDGYQFSKSVLNAFFQINMTTSTCAGFGCSSPNTHMTFALAPLRDIVHVFPDTNRYCNPYYSTWPIPNYLPVSDNWTWVNATEGKALNAGSVDLTPGTYVEGQVTPNKVQWTAATCSTDSVTMCFPASGNLSSTPVNGCPTSSSYISTETFCAAALPGPFVVKVQSIIAPTNYTWGYNPPGVWNQMPLPLGTVGGANGSSIIGLEDSILKGRVLNGVTGQVINNTLVSIEITPAGSSTAPGVETTVFNNGYFIANAPVGWDVVKVHAPNWVTNHTYAYVGMGTTNVGVIYLYPQSFITGQVLGYNGYAINTTSAQICGFAESACTPITIGGGLANTNGTYYVLEQAGHLPLGTYEIIANAPGYLSNSTWVNLTYPGTVVRADTIYLYPILGSGARPHGLGPHGFGHAPAAVPTAAWVYGRISDNATDQGLPSANIQITPIGGGIQTSISGTFTDDGHFNFSQSLGTYWMNVSEPGYYYPQSLFVVVNGTTPTVNLGSIKLVPLYYLSGQIVIDPWRWNTSFHQGVGVEATVNACIASRTFCGAAGPTDSGGFFNVSAPLGRYDVISITGTGTGSGQSAGGYLVNSTKWNVTNNETALNRTTFIAGATIFAAYTGVVRDASTDNKTPVRWGTIGLTAITPTLGTTTAAEQLTGGGGYTVFMGPGNVTALAQGSAWTPEKINLTFPYALNQTLNTTPSRLNVMPVASLEHFGWVVFNVTGYPIPYGQPTGRIAFPTASATVWTKNATEIVSIPTVGDGGGFVNMTAPPGANVTITISGADFNSTSILNVSVNQSRTTVLDNKSGHTTNLSLTPWAWIGGAVWDPVVNQGVPGASVELIDNASVSGASGVIANYQGTYLSDLPLGNPVQLAVTHGGYVPNNSVVYAHPSKLTNQTVNLTGMGVVAGRVLGYPGLNALYQAYVSVCPLANPQCVTSNTTTNGTGYFWVMAQPGTDVINISIPNYALNGTVEDLKVHSDTWTWAGTFVLSKYATVTGVVLGDPSGQPLVGANVSMCSVLAIPGQPTGPCFETVQTNNFGAFTISTPPGDYILAINYTAYNTSYFPLSLTAGEQVNLGTILLQQYGALVGNVLGSDTDAPVAGTLVRACPVWSAGNCTPLTTASGAGRYQLSGPPGAYLITASAPGYQDSYAHATIFSGQTTTVNPLFLVPVGTDQMFSITGTVTGGASDAPLVNAIVSAGGNFATSTNASGGYHLTVPWGVYLVTASANGYTSASRAETAHQNLTQVDFVLAQALYTISGTTRDGLTGNLVPNVELYSQGSLVTTSDQFGTYSLSEANGTYTFSTHAQGEFATIYAPVTFTVEVLGTSQGRNVLLFPVQAQVYGVVVNRLTGAPVVNATIVIAGATQDSYPESAVYHTGALGTFVAPVYIGNYGINATAPGYLAVAQSQKVTSNSTVAITLSMTPVSTGTTGSGGGMGLTPILVVVGVAAAAIVAFIGIGRLRTSSPPMGQRAAGEESR